MSKPLQSHLQGALQFIRNTFGNPKVIALENELKKLKSVGQELQIETDRAMMLQDENMHYIKANRLLKAENAGQLSFFDDLVTALRETIEKQAREVIALQAIITGLRQEKRYAGQKYYNPKGHKAETIYLCARWNDYYMISIGAYNVPNIITAAEFNERYGHYEIIPRMNRNQKNLS